MAADKVVLHFDMDSFYCQVDARRLGVPQSSPLVVDQWGMLLSVNYPAKALGISRKTPAQQAASMGAIVVHVCVVDIETGEKYDDINSAYRERSMYKASLDRYREASEEVMVVMKQALTGVRANFERASIDECYVDISGEDLLELFPEIPDASKLRWEGGTFDPNTEADLILARGAFLGERIRSEVFTVTGFTASCGVSLTRQVAKLSCALNKPNKLTVVSTLRTTEFMRSVPIKEIRGLGPRGMETLQQRVPWVTGSTVSSDLWSVELGSDEFGKWLYEAVRGLNDDPVKETALVAGSVQSSKQFRPSLKPELVPGMLKSLTADMLERLGCRKAKTLLVTLQNGDTVRSRQDKFPSLPDVYETVLLLGEKTGLLTSVSLDRIAVTAKDVDTEIEKNNSLAKIQVQEYLASSRLHFMGTWRTRYLQYIQTVEESGDWGTDGAVTEESKKILLTLKKTQNSSSWYLLVDMDCFFCSAAMLLKGMLPFEATPAAVASGLGATSEICSANYCARKYGVRAGMFVCTAREKCPQLAVLAIDTPTLNLCEKIWKKVIHILFLLVGEEVQRVTGRSCDEALVDLSGLFDLQDLQRVMDYVQETVLRECKVPCSVGIAPTRLLAKIATTKAKPRGTKIIISVAQGADLLFSHPVIILPGVGYSTQQKLSTVLGIETVGDLVKHAAELPRLLGAGIARKLIAASSGLDTEDENNNVIKDSTVSAEKNFGLRNLSLGEASDLLLALCESVQGRLLPNAEIDKVILKLKIAGDDWVEPQKKGGIGNAQDWSKSVKCGNMKNIHSLVDPFLADIDTTRIRGIGVAVRLAAHDLFTNDKKVTLKDMFSGKRRIENISSPPVKCGNTFQDVGAVITDTCIICGSEILIGHLTQHLLSHVVNNGDQKQLFPCPICGDPVELGDSAHVAGHFNLVSRTPCTAKVRGNSLAESSMRPSHTPLPIDVLAQRASWPFLAAVHATPTSSPAALSISSGSDSRARSHERSACTTVPAPSRLNPSRHLSPTSLAKAVGRAPQLCETAEAGTSDDAGKGPTEREIQAPSKPSPSACVLSSRR